VPAFCSCISQLLTGPNYSFEASSSACSWAPSSVCSRAHISLEKFWSITLLLQNDGDYGMHNKFLPALVSSHTLLRQAGVQKHAWRTLPDVACGVEHVKREANLPIALCTKLVRKAVTAGHPSMLLVTRKCMRRDANMCVSKACCRSQGRAVCLQPVQLDAGCKADVNSSHVHSES